MKLTEIIDLYSHAPNRPDKKEVNNKQDSIISIGDFGAQRDYPDAGYATRERIVAEHTDYTLGLSISSPPTKSCRKNFAPKNRAMGRSYKE